MRNLRSMLQGELSNWLILSTLLMQIVLLVTLSQRVGNLEKLIAGPESEPVARIPDEQGHVKGSDDAYITLVEFSDFQCPHCANAESILSQIISDHPGNIRFVYRHYPLTSIHPYAFQAPEASKCVPNGQPVCYGEDACVAWC